jgi:hypothetical protein
MSPIDRQTRQELKGAECICSEASSLERAMGTTDIVTATLKGMGFFVECRLMVMLSGMRPESGPEYVRCGVLDAPAYLPDGYYEAAFCAHTAFLHKANGGWGVGVPWRELRHSERPKRPEAPVMAERELPELP